MNGVSEHVPSGWISGSLAKSTNCSIRGCELSSSQPPTNPFQETPSSYLHVVTMYSFRQSHMFIK